MKCNRKKPEACFTCTLPDCIDDESEKTEEEFFMVQDALKGKKKEKTYSEAYIRWKREHRDYYKKYQEENRERIREYRRAYYLAHRADALEKQRIYDARKKQRKAAANA